MKSVIQMGMLCGTVLVMAVLAVGVKFYAPKVAKDQEAAAAIASSS